RAYRRALGLQEALAGEFPEDPNHQSNLGGTLNNLATLLMERGELQEARRLLERAVGHQQAARRLAPEHVAIRVFLGNHYMMLAQVCGDWQEPAAAERAYREALPIWEKLTAESPRQPDHQRALDLTLNGLGLLLQKGGRGVEAEAVYRRALPIREKLAR